MTGSVPRSMLPALSPDEQRHSQAVGERIQAEIAAAGGVVSFETFMNLALYAPGLGYYSAGSAKFGAAGDFVTAPEISALFGRCVAGQCAQVLSETAGEILEVGAGTGRLAVSVLQALAASGPLPERYAILEVSADLADRQRTLVSSTLPPNLAERVVWLERLPEKPFRGMVLANEVLDALPCTRFTIRDGTLRELGVATGTTSAAAVCADSASLEGGSVDDATFVEAEIAASPSVTAAWHAVAAELPEPLPDGYRSELCLGVDPWIGALGACLEQGIMLLFDYGLPRTHYYHPQRTDGTLRCHFKQRAHNDPFVNVGVQDITAWVDFTRVAEAALAANLEVLGFATQAAFLLATGIEAFTAEATGTAEHARRAGEARRLLMPGEMGEAFKVMALGKGCESALKGFSLQDLRRSL